MLLKSNVPLKYVDKPQREKLIRPLKVPQSQVEDAEEVDITKAKKLKVVAKCKRWNVFEYNEQNLVSIYYN